jgi:cysteine desulfurase family protein (TIGR01976 family)
MTPVAAPRIEEVRAKFPSLSGSDVYMDNAGGSQVPATVPDAIRDHMLNSYVQVGAEYPASQRATQTVADAHAMTNTLLGGDRVGRTILGSSSSTLCRMLADSYAEALNPGDEIIVGESGHEANVGPWANLAKRGFNVKPWRPNPATGVCELEELKALLSPRTKVVAFVQVSNILGHVEDFVPYIEAAHGVGARVVMDGVAYAPHLAADVEEWDSDWYVVSCYKVFGPHIGTLFGKHEAIAELTGPNHYFLANDYLPGKFELGGVNHECCAGLLGSRQYFSWLANRERFDRTTVVEAFNAIEELERPLTEQFLDFLNSKPNVRIVGRSTADRSRVPTISFVHDSVSSKAIADNAIEAGIGIRWGNFYSVRLLERMGIDPKSGVARASFAHYNTADEVDRLIKALDPIL